jgi:hypothetical protein
VLIIQEWWGSALSGRSVSVSTLLIRIKLEV